MLYHDYGRLARRLFLSCAGAIALLAAAPAPNPLHALSYLVGSWNCALDLDGKKQPYKASWAYSLGNRWLRETDSWSGGGDVLMLTYFPPLHQWRSVVTERNGGMTIFHAPYAGADHIAYSSVYPDSNMTDAFDRISNRKYTLHFVQTANGTVARGYDICVKR